jgi:transposase
MSKTRTPEITSLDPGQLRELLVQLQQHLPKGLYELVAALLGTLQWLMGVIEKKNTTLGRLRRLIFGAKTEKTRNVFPGKGGTTAAAPPKRPARGHGRNGASQYAGARRVQVAHPSLQPGDRCPECRNDKARLRERAPSRIVRILAQPMVQATVFALQVLRCCLCGKTFTAPAPPEAGTTKYDPNVGLMLGILRFGAGMPHYRLAKLQKDLGVPLPAATQWELMEQSARDLEPAHQELIRLAAQARLFHNDDTKMRIQSLKQERAQTESERTGIFTTNILCQVEDHSIALYFTGGKHAGENLADLLQHRAPGLAKPIHMCDGLSRNLPKDFEALLANCLPHGRRGFVDVKDYFPQQCQKVLEDLALVFGHDAQAKERQLSAADRLRLHQEKTCFTPLESRESLRISGALFMFFTSIGWLQPHLQ